MLLHHARQATRSRQAAGIGDGSTLAQKQSNHRVGESVTAAAAVAAADVEAESAL